MNAALFYVIGASGSGKDSLMSYAREQLPHTANATFAHRYITRTADAGHENHIALNEAEFAQRLNLNCFAMHWYSHGYHYGIGQEIQHWMAQGLSVVVNGSRAYLSQAAADFEQLRPILIEVDLAILEKRLLERGRESQQEIIKRLERAEAFSQSISHPKLTRIQNNRCLAESGDILLSTLTRMA